MVREKVWKGYIKPGKMIGNIYFAGTYDASTHLIDTGDGLILIDPGYYESLHMVVNNIWELGFKPTDVRYILVSHAHLDHMDATEALVAMSGAKTFIAKAELPLLTGEIFHYPLKPFVPDVLLEDGDTIELGNTRIECMLTPGHTDGTMSFFFDVEHNGKTYRAGMFGGAGTNTLRRGFLEKNGIPFDCRQRFVDSIERLKKIKVEVMLGNHVGNNKTDEKLALLEKMGDGIKNPFINPNDWTAFLDERMATIKRVIENDE